MIYYCACCGKTLLDWEIGRDRIPHFLCKACYLTFSSKEQWLATLINDEKKRRDIQRYWENKGVSTIPMSTVATSVIEHGTKIA